MEFQRQIEEADSALKRQSYFLELLSLCFLSQMKQMKLLLSQMSVSTASSCFNSSWTDYFCAFFLSSLKANGILASCRSEQPGVCDYSPWEGAESSSLEPEPPELHHLHRVHLQEKGGCPLEQLPGRWGRSWASRAGRSPASHGDFSSYSSESDSMAQCCTQGKEFLVGRKGQWNQLL